MLNDFDKISVQSLSLKLLNFEEKHVNEVLQIQSETSLSIWSKDDYLNEIERSDSIFKIARNVDGKIVGFALVRLLVGNSGASNILFDSSEILNIAVCSSFQKRGVGQLIFNEIRRVLEEKNVAEIWLEVRASNAKAIAFYQKNDFKFQFERKNYYHAPTENALIFRRQIGG